MAAEITGYPFVAARCGPRRVAHGHIRPFCAFACRAIANRNLVVTLLLVQARADIDSELPGDSDAMGRISDMDPFAVMALMAELYPSAYNTLFRGKSIRCATTDTTFAAMPPPTPVFLDMFCIEKLRETRAISGTSVQIYTLLSGNVGALFCAWGPESMGGLGDFWANLDAEAARTGKTSLDHELGEEVHQTTVYKLLDDLDSQPTHFESG
ncbi:hypothetical protein C8R43DRAFT_955780 [Mycena crocata]|nr:hypothetical protein C8R43DRAFT_955780 [Mycena crocata]